MIVVAAFESPTVVAGLDDVAMVIKRSSSAVVILASPNTLGHSPKARLVVTTMDVRSRRAAARVQHLEEPPAGHPALRLDKVVLPEPVQFLPQRACKVRREQTSVAE